MRCDADMAGVRNAVGGRRKGLCGAQWGVRLGAGRAQSLCEHDGGAMNRVVGDVWGLAERCLAHLLSRWRRFWGGRAVQTHA